MRKYVIVTFLALLLGQGVALELPDDSSVTVTDDGGIVVGIGEFDEGSLELDLSEDAEGFLTLTFTPEEGDAVTVEVMVSEDGTLLLVDTMTALIDEIEAGGGTADVTTVPVDEFTEDGEPQDGLDVADAAAGENGAHGRETAREARDAGGKPDFAGDDDAVEEPEEPEAAEDAEDAEGAEDAPIVPQRP